MSGWTWKRRFPRVAWQLPSSQVIRPGWEHSSFTTALDHQPVPILDCSQIRLRSFNRL